MVGVSEDLAAPELCDLIAARERDRWSHLSDEDVAGTYDQMPFLVNSEGI